MNKNLLDIQPDNQTVQQCCICYGGSSFPGPMQEALECHLSILKNKYPILSIAQEIADKMKPIQEVWEQYKHLDILLSDEAWMIEPGHMTPQRKCLYDCWSAIKEANHE